VKKKIIILVFLILLLGVGSLIYFGQRKVGEKELFYSGTIEATEADLSFQVSGRITRIFAHEGETVDTGQILAEIDKAEFQSRFEQAKANFELADKNYSRGKLAFEIAQKTLPLEVKRAEAGVQVIKAKLDELGDSRVPGQPGDLNSHGILLQTQLSGRVHMSPAQSAPIAQPRLSKWPARQARLPAMNRSRSPVSIPLALNDIDLRSRM